MEEEEEAVVSQSLYQQRVLAYPLIIVEMSKKAYPHEAKVTG